MWNDGRVRIAGEGMQNSVGRPKGGNKVARFLPSAAAFKCRINPTRRKKPGATRRADAAMVKARRRQSRGGASFSQCRCFYRQGAPCSHFLLPPSTFLHFWSPSLPLTDVERGPSFEAKQTVHTNPFSNLFLPPPLPPCDQKL